MDSQHQLHAKYFHIPVAIKFLPFSLLTHTFLEFTVIPVGFLPFPVGSSEIVRRSRDVRPSIHSGIRSALCSKPSPSFGSTETLAFHKFLDPQRLSRVTSSPFSVPVDIWTSTALPPALAGPEAQETALANLPMSNNPGGCDIDGEFYMDGMKVCALLILYLGVGSLKPLLPDPERPRKSLRSMLLYPKPHSLRDAGV